MNKSIKHHLTRVDLLPLAYWWRRYSAKSAGTFVAMFLVIEGVMLAYVVASDLPEAFSAAKLVAYLFVSRVAFLSLHEINYFINDYWSERFESKRLSQSPLDAILRPRKIESLSGSRTCSKSVYQPAAGEMQLVAWAVATRVIAYALLCLLLDRFFGRDLALGFLSLTLLFQGVFLIHNIVLLPVRIATFLGIYLGHYSLLWPPLYACSVTQLLSYVALCVPLAVGFALKYSFDRGYLSSSLENRLSFHVLNYYSLCFVCRIAYLLIAGILLISFIAGFELPGGMFVFGYLVCVDLVLISRRFVGRITHAVRNRTEFIHCHTDRSHDGSIPLETLVDHVQQAGKNTVFITDHAEDFGESEYSDLREACLAISSPEIRVVPGLEYSILSQHFLCLDLKEYLVIAPDDPEEILRLKETCSKVIWAHPHFKIRKLLCDTQYRRRWFLMMRHVEDFEVINFKGLRGLHFAWRHLFTAFVSLFFKNATFSVGADVHTQADLAEITQAYPVDILKKRIRSLVGGFQCSTKK